MHTVGKEIDGLFLPIVASQTVKLLAVVAQHQDTLRSGSGDQEQSLPSEAGVLRQLEHVDEAGSLIHAFATDPIAQDSGHDLQTLKWLLKSAESRTPCAHPNLRALRRFADLTRLLGQGQAFEGSFDKTIVFLEGYQSFLNQVTRDWAETHFWRMRLPNDAHSLDGLDAFVAQARRPPSSEPS